MNGALMRLCDAAAEWLARLVPEAAIAALGDEQRAEM